jgi:Glycopeptide antibiotics resistance protein
MIKKRIINVLFWAIFVCYVVFLVRLMLWRAVQPERGINLVPFRSILEGINFHDGIRYHLIDSQVWGNVVTFVPAGLYCMILYCSKAKPAWRAFIAVLLASLSIEVIQFIFRTGATDVDDVILNVFGGLLGIWLYMLLKKLFKTHEKTKTAITIMAALVGIPVVFMFLFVFIVNF